MKTIILGWEVTTFAHRLQSDSPTHICLHRLGSPEVTYFTPSELLAFAIELSAAATAATTQEKA